MVKPKRTMWTEEEIKYLKDTYPNSKARDVAKALGRTGSAIRSKIGELGLRKSLTKEERNNSWWAVYRGEEIVTQGNLYDISKVLGISVDTARLHTRPGQRRRVSDSPRALVFVRIPDEVDE